MGGEDGEGQANESRAAGGESSDEGVANDMDKQYDRILLFYTTQFYQIFETIFIACIVK